MSRFEPTARRRWRRLVDRKRGTENVSARLDRTDLTGRTPMNTDRHHSQKWSAEVTEHSDALDLKEDIFKSHDPKQIAQNLKQSAENSHRRKSQPHRSAMSMLTFY